MVEKIIERNKMLAKSDLNTGNMFNSFNQYGLSLLHYFFRIASFDDRQLKDLDSSINSILYEAEIAQKENNPSKAVYNLQKVWSQFTERNSNCRMCTFLV